MSDLTIPPLVIDAVPREGMKLACALMRDPAPLHWDDEAVRRAGLGERAFNPGITNAAYVLRMIGAAAGGYGDIRRVVLRFEGRLFAEDRATASARLDDEGPSPSGAVRAHVRLDRHGDGGPEPVVAGEVVFDRP
jgi:acyl dehydratase